MKQIYTFFAVMMMAMAIPNEANAYDFSAVSPSGHTLYYNIVGNVVHVVPQNSSYPYNTVNLVGNLIIPDSVTNDGTTYMVAQIGNYAFYGVCSGLTSVSIPTTVSYIGEYAFRACGITSLVIPDGVITIANNAFSDCASLETVSIGESVETIYPAFTGCQWLTTLNFDTIYIHDEGIEDVDILNARIFQRDGRIVVESGDGGPLGKVRVFDVTGRMLTHTSVSPQGAASSPNLGEQFGWRATFDVPTSGTYIVKIGGHPAKKIMVIR